MQVCVCVRGRRREEVKVEHKESIRSSVEDTQRRLKNGSEPMPPKSRQGNSMILYSWNKQVSFSVGAFPKL